MNQQPSQVKRALKFVRYCTIKKMGGGGEPRIESMVCTINPQQKKPHKNGGSGAVKQELKVLNIFYKRGVKWV